MSKKVLFGGVPGMMEEDIKKMGKYVLEEYPEAEFHYYGEHTISKEKLIEIGKDAEVLVSWDQEMDDETYRALDLKAYCAASIGYNAANINAASKNGVYVANVPDYCTDEVASHAITLMLYLYRRLYIMVDYIKEGHWDLSPMDGIRRFEDSTIGLMGFGRIPRAIVAKLRGFGVNIIAYDPFVDHEDMKNQGVKKVSLEELFKESDYLSLHSPLLDSTKNTVNRDRLSMMKDGAFIINTARGGLIEEEALYEALCEGKIAAAALDVLVDEPPSEIGKKLIELKNTVITGHSSYVSMEASDQQIRMTAKNVSEFLKGEIPASTLNIKKINGGSKNGSK